jgi:2-succinyl-5-enolpyruvyl-6-hydroxy-3-cyclohexene-1-carboxylate synthase
VIIDNDGGGIFSFLSQADDLPEDRFEQLFGTPHRLDLAALAAVHGVPAVRVETADQFDAAISDALAKGGVRIVLVATDRRANREIHDELNAAVAKALYSVEATVRRT